MYAYKVNIWFLKISIYSDIVQILNPGLDHIHWPTVGSAYTCITSHLKCAKSLICSCMILNTYHQFWFCANTQPSTGFALDRADWPTVGSAYLHRRPCSSPLLHKHSCKQDANIFHTITPLTDFESETVLLTGLPEVLPQRSIPRWVSSCEIMKIPCSSVDILVEGM